MGSNFGLDESDALLVQYRAEATGILPAEKYGLVKIIESIFSVTEVKLRTFENAPQKCVKTVKI